MVGVCAERRLVVVSTPSPPFGCLCVQSDRFARLPEHPVRPAPRAMVGAGRAADVHAPTVLPEHEEPEGLADGREAVGQRCCQELGMDAEEVHLGRPATAVPRALAE